MLFRCNIVLWGRAFALNQPAMASINIVKQFQVHFSYWIERSLVIAWLDQFPRANVMLS